MALPIHAQHHALVGPVDRRRLLVTDAPKDRPTRGVCHSAVQHRVFIAREAEGDR